MAGARARAVRGSQATTTAKQNPNTTRKWSKKAHRVEPGDIVHFHTPNIHMFGGIGTVVGYVDRHEVIVKTFGGNDTDYPPMYISLYDRAPNQHYSVPGQPHGETLYNYSNWIQKVVHRINPDAKKKRPRKPVRFMRINPETLPDVLSGQVPVDKGVHVVVDSSAPSTPEQIVAP